MGWDGMVREGTDPDVGILVAQEFSETVKDAAEVANTRKDAKGNSYRIELRTTDELLPDYVKAKLKK
jgi:hypothetical protein